MPGSRGNVGNWSELYALASLLVNRGANGPRHSQVEPKTMFFRVLEIFVEGSGLQGSLHYLIGEDGVTLRRKNLPDKSLDLQEITHGKKALSLELKSDASTRYFESVSGQGLMDLLGKGDIGASSSQRVSDFELIISDPQTGNPSPRTGYSVKSSVGSAATLLNASGATNFVFEITHQENFDPKSFVHGNSLKSHLNQLQGSGFTLSYRFMQGPIFEQNLMRVDSLLPSLLAEVLLNSYNQTVRNTFAAAVEDTFAPEDPLGKQRIFKMKQLLGSIAMGLRPTDPWDGDPTRFKGMIHVDQDFQLIFNYQHNQIDFWDYLYANVKFETASRSRHGFGRIYQEGGKSYIKLNLQIRFIR